MPPVKKLASLPVLSLAEIKAADDLKTKTVEIPEWNGSVVVREFTAQQSLDLVEAEEGDELLQLVFGMKEPAVDEEGARALLAKSGTAVVRIIEAIRELNDSSEEAVAKAEATFLAEPS